MSILLQQNQDPINLSGGGSGTNGAAAPAAGHQIIYNSSLVALATFSGSGITKVNGFTLDSSALTLSADYTTALQTGVFVVFNTGTGTHWYGLYDIVYVQLVRASGTPANIRPSFTGNNGTTDPPANGWAIYDPSGTLLLSGVGDPVSGAGFSSPGGINPSLSGTGAVALGHGYFYVERLFSLTPNYGFFDVVDIGTVPVDFYLSQSSTSGTAETGSGTTLHDTLTILSEYGFNTAVSFSVSGLPSGATATFTPSSVTPAIGGTATTDMAIACGTAAGGNYPLVITATSGSVTHSLTYTLHLADFSLTQSIPSGSVNAGGAAIHDTLTVTSLNAYNSPTVFSATGLPAGAAVVFTPSSVTPPSGGTATADAAFSAAAGTAPGTYPITVCATGAGAVRTQPFYLTIFAGSRPPSGQLWPHYPLIP